MVNGGMRAARSSSNLLSTPNGSSGSIAAPASVANMIQITPPVQSLLQPLSLQVCLPTSHILITYIASEYKLPYNEYIKGR